MKTPTLNDARKALKTYWGYDAFRAGQEKAIQSLLDGKQTLVLFPTGGGKSLCYQIPSLLFEGLTVVISPLVALMQDQVDQLNKLGIRATFINSTLPSHEIEQRLVNARNGMYKLIYIAPERLATTLWKAEQPQLNIALVAVDEAHCISEWGHDFRPAYRNIREELSDLPNEVRWIALTATATPEVKKDLLEVLTFESPEIVTNGFQRENLLWWVTKTDKKRQALDKAVLKASKLGSGIIYASTRRDCEHFAGYFSTKGVQAKAYHAGLEAGEREKVQNEWVEGVTPLVTATNAFGMGIDKPDCRYVVHYTMPFSLEAYYQEAGRAGRDGEISYPILIFKSSDVETLKGRILRSYPEYKTLVKVYDALCDELDLAVGSMHESPDPVDYGNISKRSKLPIGQVKTSLHLLQRLGIITIFEVKHPRIGIHFLVNNDYLLSFLDETDPPKAEFLDALIRRFGPLAFREMQFVDEPALLEKLDVNANQLRKGLVVLSQSDQLLTFERQAEVNLVQLTESRMSKLEIDRDKAYRYKDILLKKLNYMARYAETSQCREVFLRTYFGETGCRPCGKCDNCTRKDLQTREVTSQDVQAAKKYLANGSKTIGQMQSGLRWSRGKIKTVLMYLQREQVVEKDESAPDSYRLRTG